MLISLLRLSKAIEVSLFLTSAIKKVTQLSTIYRPVNLPVHVTKSLTKWFFCFYVDHDAVYSSCVEALTLNENKKSTYRIQHHNMAHSATVECTIRNNETVAVLHHDIEQEVVVKGYDAPQSYRYVGVISILVCGCTYLGVYVLAKVCVCLSLCI